MKKYYTFYLLICLTACLSAQLPEKKVILQTQSSEINNVYQADLNNDGINDYLVRNETSIFWYEADATSNWINKNVILPDAEISEILSFEIKDINNDGYPDIFYLTGDFPYSPTWMENPQISDGIWTVHTIEVSIGEWIGFLDADGDGDEDMVYENSGSYLRWNENIDGNFETGHLIIDDLPNCRLHSIADFDQDGDQDWAGFFYDCCLGYFINNSDGTFTYTTINTEEYQDELFTADENNDGYPDIVIQVGTGITIATFNPVTNDFNPEIYWGNYSHFNTIKFPDIDNDGDNDWMFMQSGAGAEFAKLKMIENTGGEMLFDSLYTIMDSISKNEKYFEFFNYDADGFPDLFMNDNNFLSVFINQFPENIFSSPVRLDSTYVRMDMMLPFDIDGDMDVDIFVASHAGVLAWLKYDETSDSVYAVHQVQNMEASPYPSSLQNYDIDNDGDQDVIASFHSNYGANEISYYFLNDGAGNFNLHEFTDLSFKKTWMTDADDDGDADLIGWRFDYDKLELFLNTGDTSALFTDNSDMTPTGSWNTFEISDADNDGDDDFIGTRNDYSAIYVISNTNGASTFASPVLLHSAICTSGNAIFSDDFDGDGDDDILYTCSATGSANQLKNTGGIFTASSAGNFSDQQLSTPGYMYTKDLNLDNFPDLIMSNGTNTPGTFVKLSAAAGTFISDYFNASSDFGIYTNLNGNDIIDFIGTNDFEFYIQYDVITTPPAYIIIPPTQTYLEENGGADSIGLYFTQIPQAELSVRFNPTDIMDAGAGAGEEIVYNIIPDSTALLPHYFRYFVPDDADVEDFSTQIISLTDSTGWGLYAGTLNAAFYYIVTDNDPGLFYTAIPAINEGASHSMTVHINSIPDAPLTIQLQPDMEITTGAGYGEPIEFDLPANIEAIENHTFAITAENDFIHELTHISKIPVSFLTDDSLFNSLLTDTIFISLSDDDNASFFTITPAGYFTEGLENFDITISVTSAPQSDIQIIADPDDEIDLGAGAGIAVTMNFMAGDIIPGSIIFTGIPEENLIVDGLHYGHIEFTIVTEDEFYDALSIPALIISIEDNDLSSVQHSALLDTYLEGSGEFEISFNLTSIPFADVTVTAVPDMNIDLGEGPGVAINFDFIADGALPDTKIISGIPVDNMLNDGMHSGYIFYLTNSDDPSFDGVAISGSEIFIEDNDGDGMSLLFASDLVYPEGTIEIPAAIYLFTKPTDNVFIYATPDAHLDLGDGPGMPVALIANATYEPGEALEFDISNIDDAIVEGYHDGLINFLISTDDPFYAGYILEPLLIHIEDNDLGTAIINAQKNKYLIYPAISDGIFTVESNGTTDGIVSIFDATGRLITESHISATGKSAIDISYAANGIYFMRISSGNSCFTKEIELAK